MTNQAKTDTAPQPELGFLMNHKELLSVRVRPAEFARMMGVSKQTVSIWIKQGKVTINALDGRLDVRRSIQDVLRHTSPGRLRSRVLRQAVTDALELRENLARAEDRAEIAEAALRDALESNAHLQKWADDGDKIEGLFMRLLIERGAELRATLPENWEASLREVWEAALDAFDAAGPDDLADFLEATEPSGAIHEKEGGGGGARGDLESIATHAER